LLWRPCIHAASCWGQLQRFSGIPRRRRRPH